MIHYYFHKHKRLIKVISITILIIVCLIPVFLSSLSTAADDQYTLTSNYIIRSNNANVTPSGSFSQVISNWIEVPLETSWTWTYPSYVIFNLNGLGLTSFNITPSEYLSGSSGNTYVCFFFGYVVNDNIIRIPNTSSVNIAYGESFSMSDLSVPVEATQIILSIQKGPNQNNRYYTSYPQLSYTPLVPPAPPAPSEWDYFTEFINGIIGGVVITFTSLFSLPSKILWAIIFGVPILNYLLNFFDNLLESMFPEATDLHELRPNGYVATSYEDNHPFENYSRWFYEHNGGFHW